MVKRIIDIRPAEFSSDVWEGPFDEARRAMIEAGFEDIPLWLNAFLREQQGYDSFISQNGNWIKEGVLYTPKENTRLLSGGLCLLAPEKATQAHRECREYTLEDISQEEIEKARAEGLEIDSKDLDKDRYLRIPTNRFNLDKYAVLLFGGEGTDGEKSKRTQTYGDWLQASPQKIKQITLYLNNREYIDNLNKPYANHLWFYYLGNNSDLNGDNRSLNYDSRVRGVLKNAEGVAKK